MPTPRMSDEVCRQTVDLIEQCLREGFAPPHMPGPMAAIKRASEISVEQGLCRTDAGFRTRYREARLRGMEPDWSLYRAPKYAPQITKPPVVTYAEAHQSALEPDGDPVRVAIIPDIHVCPRNSSLRRLTWIGRWLADIRADHEVQLGDWGTWDSVSGHERPGTKGHALLPGIEDDFAAVEESLERIAKERPADHKPKRRFLKGNHEQRLAIFQNATPNVGTHYTDRLDALYARYGWQTREYGEIHYIEGVGFTHAPFSMMGKPLGGETANRNTGNKSTVTIFRGHDHKREVATLAKHGPVQRIDIISCGVALEWGHIEAYAKHSLQGWFWGVCEATVQAGEAIDINFTSMITLRRRYGD